MKAPEMSAKKITAQIIDSLKTHPCNFYLINYANADMVGHSGNLQAAIKAIECVDKELGKLYKMIITKMDGTMYVTADHGNAEEMYDEKTEQPNTQHTTNPVFFIMINQKLAHQKITLPLKGLADIAPFILKNMKI